MASMHKVGKTATTVRQDNGIISVVYHATEVVRVEGGVITLNTGGWFTNTTKTRMNQAANQFGLDFYVSQCRGQWYATHKGETQEFVGNTVQIPA